MDETERLSRKNRTAFLLIDAQVNQFEPPWPVTGAEELIPRLAGLVDAARAAGAPVIFVRNCGGPEDPDQLGEPGWELHPAFVPAPGDPVLDKTTLDTFASTDLDGRLRALGAGRLVVAGLQSNYCIRATTLGALEHGYAVTVVSDGHSTIEDGVTPAAEVSAAINAELGDRVTLLPADDVRFN